MAIKDWPGGVVTDIPVEPSGNYEDSAASGVWTLDQVANYVKQDLWPTPGNVDPSKYVDALFSTYLYTGNGGTEQAIVNNVDLLNEGGLVWIKERANAGTESHQLFDTERGSTLVLHTEGTSGNSNYGTAFKSFNSDGFSVQDSGYAVNDLNATYASWTFRKKEKFFDVVTYTGDDVSGREIAHNLGSTPGFMIVKKTSGTYNWQIYHSSIGATKFLEFTTGASQTSSAVWNDTAPTDAVFTVGNEYGVNQSGDTYVAYLFASDAGGFGDDGSESIIKCGSFVPASTWQSVIDIGFEPQFILYKKATSTGDWYIHDNMRGINTGSADPVLYPNTSDAEIGYIDSFSLHANGFEQTFSSVDTNTYIYIAIRRPMKTPESGTEVFAINTADGATSPQFKTSSAGPIDTILSGLTTGFTGTLSSRLTGTGFLKTASTDAELTNSTRVFDYMNGYGSSATVNSNFYGWMFKRATGFFDVVAYTGTGVAKTEAHNLGVVPELMIVKKRNAVKNWYVYSAADSTKYLYLNGTNAFVTGSAEQIFGNDSTTVAPTSSVFSLGSQAAVNGSGDTFINYLFATLAGVSKVGSYTGTGSDLNVDCGFSAGARFILIKRSDSTGDWYVYDSARGIVAGNDPYLLLNSTAAEVTSTDYIDPLNAGFTVTSSAPAALNASGGSYIFLAIA